jgi:glycosyltransferase involved in cell wall biosynthesis
MMGLRGKRVLMLLENSHYEHDSRVRPESEALVSQGYRVTVINPRWPGGKRHEVMNGVHIYTFPMPDTGSGFLGYAVEYLYATLAMFVMSLYVLVRRGFDIVHTHNPPDILFLIAGFYKLFGKRFVYDHHDLGPELYDARFGGHGNWLVHQMLVWGEKIACGLADRVIATNESYKVMEMTRSHVPPERISVVRNGPDVTNFHLVPGDPGLRDRAGTLLGYVGVMGPQDGVDYLLRSLHHLVHDLEHTDVFCVIIGRGDTMEQLKAMAHDLNIEPYIWFTGWVTYDDMLCYLSTIDIGVDPDPSNAFNDRCTMIKIMNYMALGKPVVAFDLPEHRVTADSAAVYARPNDELDFARQIAALIADPQRRAIMGQAGLRRVETQLAWPFQAQELLRAYGDLTASFAGPARAEQPAER